jgi:hypothetical protein
MHHPAAGLRKAVKIKPVKIYGFMAEHRDATGRNHAYSSKGFPLRYPSIQKALPDVKVFPPPCDRMQAV